MTGSSSTIKTRSLAEAAMDRVTVMTDLPLDRSM